jgi:acetyl-CoA acetyltransferase
VSSETPVAVVGVYETKQARRIDVPQIHLYIEAIKGALADAGLTKDDLDGVAGHWPGPGGCNADPLASDWAKQLGVELGWTTDTNPSGATAVTAAAAAIRAGLCNTVAVVSGHSQEVPLPGEAVTGFTRTANEFTEMWGSTTPLQFGLLAQRHMHLFGTTQEQIAEVSATIRNYGHLNPNAVYYGKGPYTVDDILASRVIATPMHLLDVSTVSEGAACMIISNRVHDVPKPVYITGTASSFIGNWYVNAPVYEEIGMFGSNAATRAFQQAGLSRSDIDVFQFYDPTSFEVIRQFEAFGYCEQGEGGEFIGEGRIGPGGSHPVCTDGGCLSHGHMLMGQAIHKVKEAVEQVRGVCGARQVPHVQHALATLGGPPAGFFGVCILSAQPT